MPIITFFVTLLNKEDLSFGICFGEVTEEAGVGVDSISFDFGRDEFLEGIFLGQSFEEVQVLSEAYLEEQVLFQVERQFVDHLFLLFRFHFQLDLPDELEKTVNPLTD